jgi:hypothetical protein
MNLAIQPTYYATPADPFDTAAYRRILDDLRAMDADNDNEPAARRAHSDSPRHKAWQDAFAPLKDWSRLREQSEAGAVTSNWMMAAGDTDAPTNAEASKPNDWTEEDLILAASFGVRWKQVGGRLVPADGSLEYGPSGRLIRCGALVLADDVVAANDDDGAKPQPVDDDKVEVIGGIKRPTERNEDLDDPEDVADSIADIIGRALNPDTDDVNRGRRFGARVRVGSIVGILHRTAKSDRIVVRTEPRNAAGRFRSRKGKLPPAQHVESLDDIMDARHGIERILPKMTADAVIVMDFALRAANMADIGMLFGKSGKNAERVGRQKLLESCAEFENAQNQCAEEDAARQQALAA